MKIPTNEEIYDAEMRAANCNMSSKTIALNAMFTLRKAYEKKLKQRIDKLNQKQEIT
jgi:hypothetical protein